ncbi:MAG: TonB-dependent receptor [Bryobacter sp.]|nr:TonB-dependent receptor [Bryobacter sp.]
MRNSKFKLLPLVLLVLASGDQAWSQTTGTITGRILDAQQKPVAAAEIAVVNGVTRYSKQLQSDEDGRFTLINIPLESYTLVVRKDGFTPWSQTVGIRNAVPVTIEATLGLAQDNQSIVVGEVDSQMLVKSEETGTRVQMNQADIDKMAFATANRGVEAIMVTFPGFMQNANGAIHPRGAHNQMLWMVDGMPIADQLTGAFANAIDPSIVQTVELHTGNIPAEYGNKVSAVANLTTRTGSGSGRKFSGSFTTSAAQFNTLSQSTQVAGEFGKLGYSGVYSAMKTHRYLDSVSLDNLHNGGHSQRGFTRLDYMANDRNVFRLVAMAGSSPFELANLRSQHALGMQQRQMMRDAGLSFSWLRTLDAVSLLDTNVSWRSASSQLYGSGPDTPVTADQARRLGTFSALAKYSRIAGRHNLRGGVDYQRYGIRENFTFGLTDPAFNAVDRESFNPELIPFDLTRGGSRFVFGDQATGRLAATYLQDQIRLGRLFVSLGLRYDNYRILTKGNQLQPRIGVAYTLPKLNTVLRASYNRLYQTPVNENLLLSSSPAAAALAPPAVKLALGNQVASIQPERQNFYEVGLQQGFLRRFTLSSTIYHKQGWDQADNNNFFNSGIIFPIALLRIRVNSFESRFTMAETKGISASFSATYGRAISTPPFTGGIYLGNEAIEALSAGPFFIDHDQRFATHALVSYTNRRGFYTNLSSRYDSGLVINPSDPAVVAADPDFADLLPLVRLNQDPARAKGRLINDVVLGYQKALESRGRYDLSLQFTNLFNAQAVYNFQSIFVGTRVVQPRSAGLRLRYEF